jgi:8-oxo-dGTP pyrophosphatase MutT (NUDIX family)
LLIFKEEEFMKLINDIQAYIPFNEQEELDKKVILKHLEESNNIFLRDNQTVHMTASAWVVNPERTKVLMVHHNIYNSWSWLGGHADGDTDLFHVAIKEVQEESGITTVTPVHTTIFSLETLTVDGHEKKGKYVPSHLHLNITYLLEANDDETLIIQPDENSGVEWFELDKAVEASTEPWFQDRIYSKLNKKLKSL